MSRAKVEHWSIYFTCPVMDEGLFDVPEDAIILREKGRTDVTFRCPCCKHYHTISIPHTRETLL